MSSELLKKLEDERKRKEEEEKKKGASMEDVSTNYLLHDFFSHSHVHIQILLIGYMKGSHGATVVTAS